jgi:predicted phosphodiesterase
LINKKSHCVHGHLYNEANTYHTKSGGRQCRACWRVGHTTPKEEQTVTEEVPPSQWDKPAETPSAAIDAEHGDDESFKCPKALLPKERPSENQAKIPIWPIGGMFVDGDQHFPVADPRVTAAKVAFVQDMKPDLWVNLGDLLDFWLASSFTKEASRLFGPYGARLQDEVDSARPYVNEICSIVKQAHFIPGNHEKRHERLIDANPSLYGLRALGWKSILQYPDNFFVHPYGTRLKVNKAPLYIVHGDTIVPERVVAPAQYILNKRVNQTTIFGHTHKAQECYRTGYDENREPIIYGAINTGHGTIVAEQHYAGPEPEWQTAFAYVEFYENRGKPRFSVHLILVIDGQFKFRGKVYKG